MTPLEAMVDDTVVEVVERLREGYDPIEQINLCQKINEILLKAQSHTAALRREAVRTLRMEGWTLSAIAEQTGMTHQRVAQIEAGADRKEKG